ncbi:hypothetical protein FGF66_02995 [Chlorobaculum thiosulfatiphilum]|uniref:Uncharacterized protein n=1 Tax=Chlorobaculum thiosulfatiphilum TaxID=115852 RepID=A0A5C4S8M6_CHLTI|nr:hypothetical protein [Chlorobaculum thiosulfatiphilum]TNJ39913.1 hypothetical protein FGF66_02995 [Chlorobaculum thiosulfatiphilum]
MTGDGQPLSEELPQSYNRQNQHEAASDGYGIAVVGLGVFATRTAVFNATRFISEKATGILK